MFTLTIETRNQAFDPDPFPEVARILRVLADDFDAGLEPALLYDINGNSVGSCEYEPTP